MYLFVGSSQPDLVPVEVLKSKTNNQMESKIEVGKDLKEEFLEGTYYKAKIISKGRLVFLQSYSTIVACYNTVLKEMTVIDNYSMTTRKHINKFLEMYGYKKLTKKEMITQKINK